MQQPHNIIIHEFDRNGLPHFDEEGDQRLGFYYQFTDENEQPVSDLIGPYHRRKLVEDEAIRAYNSKDF